MNNDRILKFLREYIKYNTRYFYPIIELIENEEIDDHIKDNSKSVSISKAFDTIYKIIENKKNIKYKETEEWHIINVQNRDLYEKIISPSVNFILSTWHRFFEIDKENKSIIYKKNSKEEGVDLTNSIKGQNWFLVKTSPFFNIRNSEIVFNKIKRNNFSKIEKVLLRQEKINVNEVIKEIPYIEGYKEKFDEHQFKAFKEAISSKNFYIFKGPPGTGKTQVIANIIEFYSSQGKNVIFASSLHSALDSLISRFNKMDNMKNRNVIRASAKKNSVFFSNKDANFRNSKNSSHGKILVTTFASQIINNEFRSLQMKKDDNVLIIDEASATNMLNILSKTDLANKLIISGDDNQFYPIYSDLEKKEFKNKELEEEYDFIKKYSLFDHVYSYNDKKEIRILLNNYRSNRNLLNKINFFYKNNLKSKSKLEQEDMPIHIIKVEDDQNFIKTVKGILQKHQKIIPITYYKNDVYNFNKIFLSGKDEKRRFKTLLSIQGLEDDYVLWVISNRKKGNKNLEIDYRNVNVAISRAKKKIYIIDYSTDKSFVTEERMVKAMENFATYKIKGISYSIKDIADKKTNN